MKDDPRQTDLLDFIARGRKAQEAADKLTRDGPPDRYPLPDDFDGDTHRRKLDKPRLATLLGAVASLMLDGKWRTLAEIRSTINRGSEASISARLRDLRKPKFGGYAVQRRRRGAATRGLHEYRVQAQAANDGGGR